MRIFHSVDDLCGFAVDCALDELTVSVLVDGDLAIKMLKWVFSSDLVNVDMLNYDLDLCDDDYWCIFKVDDECDCIGFSIDFAYDNEKDKYLAPPSGIILVSENDGKCIADVLSNPYSGNPRFEICSIECDKCDCCCECEESLDEMCDCEDEDLTTESDSMTLYKAKDGALRGVSKSFSRNDDGISTWSNHTFFSDCEETVKNITEMLKSMKI